MLEPIEAERRRRRDLGRSWRLPIKEVHHGQNKEMRVATLEPLLVNGWLRFSDTLGPEFWTQLQDFPRGEHDDGIDALESAVALLRGAQPTTHRGNIRRSRRNLKEF